MKPMGSQRDVIYLGRPTAPSYRNDILERKRQNNRRRGVAGFIGCVHNLCAHGAQLESDDLISYF
jgi:hypothetical protein